MDSETFENQFGMVLNGVINPGEQQSTTYAGFEEIEEHRRFSQALLDASRQGKIVAILSTTVLPLDGTYEVRKVSGDTIYSMLEGVPHYIGHPSTASIIEKTYCAVPAKTKLFAGLQPGEVAICFAIAQGKSTRATEGFTTPHQDVTLHDLTSRVIRRIS